jgi:hypothetical protein
MQSTSLTRLASNGSSAIIGFASVASWVGVDNLHDRKAAAPRSSPGALHLLFMTRHHLACGQADLCSTVPQPPSPPGAGRLRLPLSDMLIAAAYKVYVGYSSRRFTSDLHNAYADGLIDSKPNLNSDSRYLSDPAVTDTLMYLVALSGLPLKAVESDLAVDSSGSARRGSSGGTARSTAR